MDSFFKAIIVIILFLQVSDGHRIRNIERSIVLSNQVNNITNEIIEVIGHVQANDGAALLVQDGNGLRLIPYNNGSPFSVMPVLPKYLKELKLPGEEAHYEPLTITE